jgi:adenine-specific DNA-methyltransferase
MQKDNKKNQRESLREKGQFWTPDWIAEPMVEYALSNRSNSLFDPAFGAGAFLRASQSYELENKKKISFSGMDTDETIFEQAAEFGHKREELANIEIRDFIFAETDSQYDSIIANPPYIRHHRLSAETKIFLKKFSRRVLGKEIDGRAGLQVYFLIRALQSLKPDGHLAVILPADVCEGVFAKDLWNWITNNFCLDTVITFSREATPFPNIDTNPIVFLIRNSKPNENYFWIKCNEICRNDLVNLIKKNFLGDFSSLEITKRKVSSSLETGFSRPLNQNTEEFLTLGDFADVVRGIATGANEFFFLTEEEIDKLQIPKEFFVTAIGRTGDVETEIIDDEAVENIRRKKRPTFLLNLNGEPFASFPQTLQKYLKYGETLDLPKRPLISQRKIWYKMETRKVPPFLFAYLGRRNTRFIRNIYGVLPLTSFLCVYPKKENKEFIENLWKVLRYPETLSNLSLIGKSYGSGAIKVEPRSLEKLPLSKKLLIKYNLIDSETFEKFYLKNSKTTVAQPMLF